MNSRLCLLRGFFVTATALIGTVAASSHGQPVNDMFTNRIVIAGTNIVVYGTTVGATKEAGEPNHAGNVGGASIWWSWQAPTNGIVSISTAGSSFDTLLGVYTGSSISALATIASDDDDPESGALTSKVEFTAVANQIYQIAVDGYGGRSGTVTLSVLLAPPSPQPVNDMFANRIVIAGTNIVVYGTTVGATREAGEPNHAGSVGGASIWWSWQAPTNGIASISTAGSGFDTLMGVYTGSSVSALTTIASDDDDPESGALTSKVAFPAAANQIYQIAVDGYGGASGTVTLSVQLAPPSPPPPAPAWQLPDPTGPMVNSTNFAGKVVILDFWATWCVPCKVEMPDLVALQDKYRADGLVVVGADVSWSGENAATVLSFLASFTPTVNYQVVMSDAATESQFGDIAAIPTTFIIDRQNRIQKKYVGTQTYSTLENQILPLLYGNTRLAGQRNGTQCALCWPTNAAVFTLQWATNLVNPAWSDWPTTPTVVNGANTVPIPMTASPCYFRLRLTN